jgi:7-cyano-7-deazaguanine reductase
MSNLTDKIASKFLGKKTNGSNQYDPSLLVAVPRLENRLLYNISSEKLPFRGFDVWHAYEFSTMTKKGLPVTRLMQMKYSSDSEFIVESKSLKLYLNSFNMTRLGESIEECLIIAKNYIQNDLSAILKTKVEINFLDNKSTAKDIFNDFDDILNFVDLDSIEITNFKETPELLQVDKNNDCSIDYKLKFNSLRSNCRVTHQPDFGEIFVYYKSQKHISETSLLKYLCSFRSEYHFHEECCEMIYKRLLDILNKDDELFVCILYTRRGGIDICPVRYTSNLHNSQLLCLQDLSVYFTHGFLQ